jgi:hypothetical protein
MRGNCYRDRERNLRWAAGCSELARKSTRLSSPPAIVLEHRPLRVRLPRAHCLEWISWLAEGLAVDAENFYRSPDGRKGICFHDRE